MNRNAPMEYRIISQGNEIARNGSPEYRESVAGGGVGAWGSEWLDRETTVRSDHKMSTCIQNLNSESKDLDGACVTTSNCAINFLFFWCKFERKAFPFYF